MSWEALGYVSSNARKPITLTVQERIFSTFQLNKNKQTNGSTDEVDMKDRKPAILKTIRRLTISFLRRLKSDQIVSFLSKTTFVDCIETELFADFFSIRDRYMGVWYEVFQKINLLTFHQVE